MKKIELAKICIGDSVEIEKCMTIELVKLFADISNDHNPVHLDKEYAKSSRYKGQIIHGLMAASLFSGLFGMKLPGEGCVYKSQNLRFKRPIYVGDTVVARVEVSDVDVAKKHLTFSTQCLVNNRVVIDGESQIFVP